MFTLRTMQREDWPAVADLIFLSTNTWYQVNRGYSVFSGSPEVCELFCRVYEDLDPGGCLIAEQDDTGKILGSCFFHSRETHVSLGIMNVHPSYFGTGVAHAILDRVIAFAKEAEKPLRLVSSALNLDSFSLYTRKGFVPFAVYQDMLLQVPEEGIDPEEHGIDVSRIRPATLDDIPEMSALELEVSGISRERDYRYFIENKSGDWSVSVSEGERAGGLDGFLVSVNDPGFKMLGPGVAGNTETAAALIVDQLNHYKGGQPLFLIPADNRELVARFYGIGARNCELHFAQVLGEHQPVNGVVMPTFMPETG